MNYRILHILRIYSFNRRMKMNKGTNLNAGDVDVLNNILNLENHLDDVDETSEQCGSVKVKSSSVKADTMVSNNCTEEIEQQFEEVKDEKLKKLESERRRLEKENEEKKKLLEKLLQQEQMMLHAAEKGEFLSDAEELKEVVAQEGGSDDENNSNNDSSSECWTEVKYSDEDGISIMGGEEELDKLEDGDGGGRVSHSSRTHPSESKKKKRSRSAVSSHSREKNTNKRSDSRKRRRDSQSGKKTARSKSRSRSNSPEKSSKLEYLFRDAKYFLIKSSNHENVALAQAKGVWSTPPGNEVRINQAFKNHSNVILVFSVKESGKFQGYARVAAESDHDHPPIRWVLPVGISASMLSGVFTLDWINRQELRFEKILHVRNKWNENQSVKVGRDGQELEPEAGEKLCRSFPRDPKVDLTAIAQKARHSLKKRGLSIEMSKDRQVIVNPARSRHDRDRNREGGRRRREPKRAPPERVRRNDARERIRFDGRGLERPERERRHDPPPAPRLKTLQGMYSDRLAEFDPHRILPPMPPTDFRFLNRSGYGRMHPPPPPPPPPPLFVFDRYSRLQPTRHISDHHEFASRRDDYFVRHGSSHDAPSRYAPSRDNPSRDNPSRDTSRHYPYDRYARDRRR